MCLVIWKRKKLKRNKKKKHDAPLNPISPDEGDANDPEALSETASHSNFGEGSFN